VRRSVKAVSIRGVAAPLALDRAGRWPMVDFVVPDA
jgi:hypothetical protein